MRQIGRHAGTGRFMRVAAAIKAGSRAVVETYAGRAKADELERTREQIYQNGFQQGRGAALSLAWDAVSGKRLIPADGSMPNMSRADYNAGIQAALDAIEEVGRK